MSLAIRSWSDTDSNWPWQFFDDGDRTWPTYEPIDRSTRRDRGSLTRHRVVRKSSPGLAPYRVTSRCLMA